MSKMIVNNGVVENILKPQKDPYDYYSLKRSDYSLFRPKYYTAEDVSLYIGDIWIDEVTFVQYSIMEDVFPVFGYSSYTYDAIARGKRMVQGTIGINFQTANYLRAVLENSESLNFHLSKAIEEGRVEASDLYKNKLSDVLKMSGMDSFEEMANQYKNDVWGNTEDYQNMSADAAPYFLNSQAGVEIMITFGPEDEIQSGLIDSGSSKTPDTSIEVINGVQFMSMSKVTGVDMSPSIIAEEFSFIARDISGTSLRGQNIKEMIASGRVDEPEGPKTAAERKKEALENGKQPPKSPSKPIKKPLQSEDSDSKVRSAPSKEDYKPIQDNPPSIK